MTRRWMIYTLALAIGGSATAPILAQSRPSGEINASAPAIPPAGPDSADRRPLVVRVSSDKPITIANAESGSPAWLTALLAALPALVALVGSLIVVYLGNRQSGKNSAASLGLAATNTQAAINQRANELEVARIDQWLATFFGSFMQLSEENKRIAELLRARQPDPSFRTLRALLDPEWRKSASETDLNLISRIVATGIALRTLIREKAGPTSPALSKYLARAAAHFTILELADAGALTEPTDDFDQYVYPRQLDAVLGLERDRLEARRDQLLSDLAVRHAPAPALVIPPELELKVASR
jgi:hypothetical protein